MMPCRLLLLVGLLALTACQNAEVVDTTLPNTIEPEVSPTVDDVGHAATAEILHPLIPGWLEAETVCRGSSGPASDAACKKREVLVQQLYRAGFCHGREGEAGYQMEWHRCAPGSFGYVASSPTPGSDTSTDMTADAVWTADETALISEWEEEMESCDPAVEETQDIRDACARLEGSVRKLKKAGICTISVPDTDAVRLRRCP